MKIVCIIPLKSNRRKSRLSDVLEDEQREKISMIMFLNVARKVKSVFGEKNVYTVTSDIKYAKISEELGLKVIREKKDEGVNLAVTKATLKKKADFYFVFPSDLPLLLCNEVKKVYSFAKEFDVIIAPSLRFDGTNLLGFRKGIGINLSYDNNSFWNHLCNAGNLHAKTTVLSNLGLMLDIDTQEDVSLLAKTKANKRVVKKILKVWNKKELS